MKKLRQQTGSNRHAIIDELDKQNKLLKEELRLCRAELYKQEEELKAQVDELRKYNDNIFTVTKALHESETKYRTIVETANEGIWVMDSQCRTTYVNRRMAEMLGYTPGEVIGRYFGEFLSSPEMSTNWFLKLNGKSDLKEKHDHKLIRKNGSLLWVMSSFVMMRDDEGRFTGSMSLMTDVTDRKRADEKIAHIASFPDLDPNPVIEVDNHGDITFINRAARKMFPDLEALGKSHPLIRDIGLRQYIFGKGGRTQLVRDIEVNGVFYQQTLLYLPDSGMTRVYSIDITRRKRAEEALRLSEERYRTFFNNLQETVTIIEAIRDKNCNVVDWVYRDANNQHLSTGGWSRETILGKRVSEILTPAIVDLHMPVYAQVLETGHPYNYETFFKGVYLMASVFRLNPNTIAITSIDITERKKAEEALKLDEARLEALAELNNMADASDAGLFDYALNSALRITESRTGVIMSVNHDETTAYIRSITNNVMDTCKIGDGRLEMGIPTRGVWADIFRTRQPALINEYSAPHPLKSSLPEGHMPVITVTRLMMVPVIENGRIVAISKVGNKESPYTDADVRQLSLLMNGLWRIVSRKRAENEVLEAKSRAELYLDLMGHDINNLHQVALGYLEMIMDDSDPQCAQIELLRKPIEALQRSSMIIDNVRKLQKVQTSGLITMRIDLITILRDVQTCYQRPGINIFMDAPDNTRYEVISNELLTDVFSNLVGNAVKHSEGENVDISIIINRVNESDRAFYQISVEDNGPGIPDDMKARIFNRMQRGDTKVKGIGLGLYLVKSLVESYYGRVWVEDRISGDYTKGSRFIVRLPAAK